MNTNSLVYKSAYMYQISASVFATTFKPFRPIRVPSYEYIFALCHVSQSLRISLVEYRISFSQFQTDIDENLIYQRRDINSCYKRDLINFVKTYTFQLCGYQFNQQRLNQQLDLQTLYILKGLFVIYHLEMQMVKRLLDLCSYR